MELLATGNSICCPDLLYGDVSRRGASKYRTTE